MDPRRRAGFAELWVSGMKYETLVWEQMPLPTEPCDWLGKSFCQVLFLSMSVCICMPRVFRYPRKLEVGTGSLEEVGTGSPELEFGWYDPPAAKLS